MAAYPPQGASPALLDKESYRISAGCVFGESALHARGDVHEATLRAVGEVRLLQLKYESFFRTLGSLRAVIEWNVHEEALARVGLFAALNPSERTTLIKGLVETQYAAGQNIIVEGERGDTFYMIKSGTVRVTRR